MKANHKHSSAIMVNFGCYEHHIYELSSNVAKKKKKIDEERMRIWKK